MKKILPLVIFLVVTVLAIIFVARGMSMHAKVVPAEEAFHELQADYYIKGKTIRDAAETGSQLNEQLVAIVNTPSELMRLKLIGVGRILTGIAFLLFGIMIALIIMPYRIASMMRRRME